MLPSLPRNWDILLFTTHRSPAWWNWFLMILPSTPNNQLLSKFLHLKIVLHLRWNMAGQWCCWKLSTSNRSSFTSIKKIGQYSCMIDFHLCLGLMYLWLTDYQRMYWLPEYGLCPCPILYHLVCCWGGKKKINHCS